MWTPEMSEAPSMHVFDMGEILRRIGVRPEAWEEFFGGYLEQLLFQFEEEIRDEAGVNPENLSDRQLASLVVQVGRYGAVAALVAVDSLLPEEPPW